MPYASMAQRLRACASGSIQISSARSNLAVPRRCCRGTTVSTALEILFRTGLGLAPGPRPKCVKLMAPCLPEDAPQLRDALCQHGSAAKSMSLWLHTKFVREFESGGTSVLLPRYHRLTSSVDSVSKRLGLGTGPEPKMCKIDGSLLARECTPAERCLMPAWLSG